MANQTRNNPEFETLLAQSIEELKAKTAAHDAGWHLGEASWDVDQEAGMIVFTTPNITATCSVQVIGTYNADDGTWMWGWDHPSVNAALQKNAKRVRDYGEKHKIDRLTKHKFACTVGEAWEFSALACKLGSAHGAYRGPIESTFVFMTFDEVTLTMTP